MVDATPDDERFKALVQEHSQRLIEEAFRIHQEHPSTRMVGLILERDAPQAARLRSVLPEADSSVKGFAGVIPRAMALELIAGYAPQGLDWLFDEGTPPNRQLPVLVCLSNGMRTAAIGYTESR